MGGINDQVAASTVSQLLFLASDNMIQAEEIIKMKKSLTNIYVTHNAKDKTYD